METAHKREILRFFKKLDERRVKHMDMEYIKIFPEIHRKYLDHLEHILSGELCFDEANFAMEPAEVIEWVFGTQGLKYFDSVSKIKER